MKRNILQWELWGAVAISLMGSVLHFVFDWSGRVPLIGIIAAVNESVWEHFKLAFWPAVLYAVLEHPFLKKETHNFIIAKAAGIYSVPVTIGVVFYSYTAIIGREILIVDILIFFVAVAVGQILSYKILTANPLPSKLNRSGMFAIILLALSYAIFTFYPPHLPLFLNPVSGGYGIR